MKNLFLAMLILINGTLLLSQNVGIGTSTPAYSLHLVKDGAGYGFVHEAIGVAFGSYIDVNGGWIGTITDHPLLFYTNNGLQQMTLSQMGNLGIGTTLPSKRLHVAGDIQLGSDAIWFSSADNRIINFGDMDFCYIGEVGADDRMELRASTFFFNNGNVGIGVSNPTAEMEISGHTKTTTFQMTSGSGMNKFLRSDANGNATWENLPVPGSHTVGESFGGGIVFYVYDNGFHGLIAATTDQSTGIAWGDVGITTNAVRDGQLAGMADTERIVIKQGTGSYAAQLCANYQGGGFGDWYLPSKEELYILYFAQDEVGGFAAATYWSSTEYSAVDAWAQFFTNGTQGPSSKSNTNRVRAIKSF